MKIAVPVVLLLALAIQPVPAQDKRAEYREIVAKVIQKGRENEELKKRHLRYRAIHTIEKRGSDGSQKSKTSEVLEFRGDGKALNRILIEKDGRPPLTNEQPDGYSISINEILATRYELLLIPLDASNDKFFINEREFYRIDFYPKKGLKNKTDQDEVINRAHGQILVNADTLAIEKIEAWLPSGFSLAWGFFTMKSAKLSFEQEEFHGVMVEKLATINARYDTPFTTQTDYTEIYAYSNFEYIE